MDSITPSILYSDLTGDFGTAANFNALLDAINGHINLIDASNNVGLSIAYMDGSLAVRDTAIATMNSSTGTAFLTNASLGLAFNGLTNASLGSTGTFVKYRPDLGIGLKDASGNVRDLVAIDASLYLKTNWGWFQWNASVKTLG